MKIEEYQKFNDKISNLISLHERRQIRKKWNTDGEVEDWFVYLKREANKLYADNMNWDYTSESGDTYTREDFVEIAKGNLEYAILLRERVEWQHPETLVVEDLMYGEIREESNTYVLC